MRSILLSKADESYLQKCALELGFAFGIIIGHMAEPEKYVIVHLAKNGEDDMEVTFSQDDDCDIAAHGPHKIEDISTQALTNQWISACKMVPGSFKVLGIFAVSISPDIVDEQTFKNAKKILYDVHNLLLQASSFCSSFDDVANNEYIFLAYSSANRKALCKVYTHSSNGGAFAPVDCRFVEKPFEWYTFESSYEFDDIFPIADGSPRINIEHQFQRTIEGVKLKLDASEIFIQNESVDDELTLDAYVKKKNPSRKSSQPEERLFKANIYLPVKCQLNTEKPIKVRQFNGTIRYSGVISSRIWCNPKNTIANVKRFLCDDILRSLAARIQVYCDGLTEANVSNDAIFISEPPRRVYFNLPGGPEDTPIQFSEYIFRGEAPTVAVAQAKQILDLDIKSDAIVADVEGLPDDETFSDISSEMPALVIPEQKRDLTRTMYMLGIAVSLLVLFISILLHFLLHE